MKIKNITDVEITKKRVLLRVDFNVPIKNGAVIDDYKIKRTLPTIKYLLKNHCQIILITHLGRPDGRRMKSCSLMPVFDHFKKMLPLVSMRFVKDKINDKLIKRIKRDFKERIIFLENIRFYKQEIANDKKFAGLLAKLARIYVNEAFAVSHRAVASVSAITEFLPAFAGLNLAAEIEYLSTASSPKASALALLGGIKISTKINVLCRFLKIYDKVLLGGGLANTMLAVAGYDVGGSLIEKKEAKKNKNLLKFKNLILPIDLIVADKRKTSEIHVVQVGKNKKLCSKFEAIFDIGPATMKLYVKLIKRARTIVWNGPVGFLENERFAHGSIVVAKAIAARASGRAVGIAGGGETLYAIHLSKMEKYFDFVSTGGGAMLEFLEGRQLPGLNNL